MGAADTVTKAYMKENTVFADAFNYLLYRGRAVVDPAQLQELDTTEIALPFGAQDEDGKPQEDAVQKYRDVLKSAVIKEDGEAAYILLGIENQTDIHYAMPVRNAVYDALQYGRQVGRYCEKASPGGLRVQRPTAGANTSRGSIKTTGSRRSSHWHSTLARTNGMGRCRSTR